MRLLLVCTILVLVLPPAVLAGGSDVRVSAFYYPWYGTAAENGAYEHWSQDGHQPPHDIAAAFYPARGVYSSSDANVVDAQMQELRSAGIDEIAVSWWGRGSPEDARLPEVVANAHAGGIAVAVHLEPYPGRSVASTVADVAYLRGLGVQTFYVYRALDLDVADWAAASSTLHEGGTRLFAQTSLVGAAAKAGFDGVYTYDIVTYGADKFARLCREAHAVHLLCAPSVGPGYDARRGDGDTRVKPRLNGATYDRMWSSAIAAGADLVTITSFNEWHEGTQIEPAAPLPARGHAQYLSYDGAWHLHDLDAEYAYLVRTAYWSLRFRGALTARPAPSSRRAAALPSPNSTASAT